jgi:AraC-like DNA-binding protein
VGASPVYLSQEFTRTQGVPLYRYLMGLRLNRALLELPHCNDITGLAVYLGFSSHSHFSATFRRFFGMTPAEFRDFGAGEGAWRERVGGKRLELTAVGYSRR